MLKPYYFAINIPFVNDEETHEDYYDRVVWAADEGEADKLAQEVADREMAADMTPLEEVQPNCIITLRNGPDGNHIRMEPAYETAYGHTVSSPSFQNEDWWIIEHTDPVRY